jgi:4a-hydroxytetrahydrobiopterin dehydratase
MPTEQERPYTSAETTRELKALPGWHEEAGWLVRAYETEGWPTTLMLVNAIGYVAEAADHHPDLAISWARVTVRLQTHTARGITAKDVELARAIDAAALWRPSGGALRGTSRTFVRPGDGA